MTEEEKRKDKFYELKTLFYNLVKAHQNIDRETLINAYINKNQLNCIRASAYYTDDARFDTIIDGQFTVNQILDNLFTPDNLPDRPKAGPVRNTFEQLFTNFTPRRLANRVGLSLNNLCKAPGMYKKKFVDFIINRYNVNNNWYDFSCGWGLRLYGALTEHINYYGTDPNEKLSKQLNKMANEFYEIFDDIPRLETDIRCQGSEEFVPEWENKIGLAFSSPPYFNLEIYNTNKQHIESIDNWINDYMKPTLNNIYRYVIKNGYLVINITNSKQVKYDIEKMYIENAVEAGFKYIEAENIFNASITQNSYKGISKYENFHIFLKE